MTDVNSLAHTSWNCKYHVVFAPQYRRKVFFGEKRREIGSILRTLCHWKGIKIIEAGPHPHADRDTAKDSSSKLDVYKRQMNAHTAMKRTTVSTEAIKKRYLCKNFSFFIV